MFDDGSWFKTVADWGAYGIAGITMLITRGIHNRFKDQENDHKSLLERVVIVEKDLLKGKLEANDKFVDKAEYYNTMNRIDSKLDKMSEKIDHINTCFINKTNLTN